VVADILGGLVAVAECLIYWRFSVCFIPAVALALFLYFSIPDRLVSIPLAALILTLAGAAGRIWTNRSSRRTRNSH
jgi:hypothetical protein